MSVGESVNVLGGFLKITFVQNTGAAFNMMSGQRIFLVIIPVAAIAAGVVYMLKNKNEHPLMHYALTMIIAGGIGNIIDRIAFGWVTDMFDLTIFPPVFNVADIAVVVGCVLLIFYVLAGEKLGRNEMGRN